MCLKQDVATYRSQQPVSDIYICKLVNFWFFFRSKTQSYGKTTHIRLLVNSCCLSNFLERIYIKVVQQAYLLCDCALRENRRIDIN